MRRVLVLALLALALPMAAWADIAIVNQFGSISVSTAGITSKGIQLIQFDTVVADPGKNIGSLSFGTGAQTSPGSSLDGATYSDVGSWFNVYGGGPKIKAYVGCTTCTNPITLFTGSFVGTITLTLDSVSPGGARTYTLSGDVSGMLWNGHQVSGFTTQNIYSTTGQWTAGIGHLHVGGGELNTPEPGTLGLLGTGLVGIAGMIRRKLIGS